MVYLHRASLVHPYSLFSPYQALYMRKIGLSSLEIGTTLSLGFLLQVFFAFIGGALTDKMGAAQGNCDL